MKAYMACTIANQRTDCSNTAQLTCGKDLAPAPIPSEKTVSTTDPLDQPQNDRNCALQREELDTCLKNVTGSTFSEGCSSCVDDSFQDVIFTCSALRAIVCPKLRQCDCGACATQVVEYYDCIVDTATFGCESICAVSEGQDDLDLTAGSAECMFEKNEMITCIDAFANDPLECRSCIGNAYENATGDSVALPFGTSSSASVTPSSASCSEMEEKMCSAVNSCSCGSCTSEIDRYFSCEAKSLHQCKVDCELTTIVQLQSASTDASRRLHSFTPVLTFLLFVAVMI